MEIDIYGGLDLFYSSQFVLNESSLTHPGGKNVSASYSPLEHIPVLAGTFTGTVYDGFVAVQTFVTTHDGVFKFTDLGTPNVKCTTKGSSINLDTGEVVLKWIGGDPGANHIVVSYEYNMEINTPSPDIVIQLPNNIKTPIVVTDPKLIPAYQTKGSACADLIAVIPPLVNNFPTNGKVALNYRTTARIKTGIKVAIPEGYKMCIAARSSFAEKGLLISNAPAQIDSDYRGEVEVLVLNAGREIIEIRDGERFAQCWLEKVYKFDWDVVDTLGETARGENGFGSTGK